MSRELATWEKQVRDVLKQAAANWLTWVMVCATGAIVYFAGGPLGSLVYWFFTASFTLYVWVFWLLIVVPGILVSISLILLLLHHRGRGLRERALQRAADEQRPSKPLEHAQFTEDLFDGVRWRWAYDSEGGIVDLDPFCAQCDCELVFEWSPSSLHRGAFHCVNCDTWSIEHSATGTAALQDAILRLIRRKIRLGEWRERVPPDSSEEQHAD